LKTIEANAKQLNLFDEYVAETFKIVKKLPYKFKFKFKDIN
jgi:hypothetical protein